MSQELQVKIQDLSVESLEDLAEALLDFQNEDELKVWLNNHFSPKMDNE